MDDPWDVKSVRKSGQYTSCMKLNGVPLLPPVLSKECRSEMQYYRLMAREVEKRILQLYVESDTDSNEDNTDATEITEYVQESNIDTEEIDTRNNDIIADFIKEQAPKNEAIKNHPPSYNLTLSPTDNSPVTSRMTLDFSFNINESLRQKENCSPPPQQIEIPERDYNCMKQDDLKYKKHQQVNDNNIIEGIVNFRLSKGRDQCLGNSLQESACQNGLSSLTTKSFTGSLNNIYMASDTSDIHKPLVRQYSYTILNPSPQLLAHLEVQSLNLGVDMSCISMSESLSNLSPGKKRRSWDLESAKVKWSNMAKELKQKNITRPTKPKKHVTKTPVQRPLSPSRAKSVAAARTKYSNLTLKHATKTEALQKNKVSSPPRTRKSSPVRDTPSASTIVIGEPMTSKLPQETKSVNVIKEPSPPKSVHHKKECVQSPKRDPKTPNQKSSQSSYTTPQQQNKSEVVKTPVKDKEHGTPKQHLISEAEDPAGKVRELYEKIQKQQLVQMASLVEKQKREQMLLHQAFEEQNKLLFKQLKTICPTSPDQIKEAWAEKSEKSDRGPVSLSQLINPKTPSSNDSPISSTLTDSNKCLDYCDDILQKSKDISSVLKSHKNQNGGKSTPIFNSESSQTRTNSPVFRNTPASRKLNYDTSLSTERDVEPILTDRTNDTLADLNVTFPSDSEDCMPMSMTVRSPICAAEVTVIHRTSPVRTEDPMIKSIEQAFQKSITSSSARARNVNCQPTARQLAAACTIVAYAKGFLVRRLMKTSRVQSTVQTIKDALMCALQLHQDREGIRGADVDLHRRLIQQITAACYALHDTFITSSPTDRCAMIAADRTRRASLAARPPLKHRHSDQMSQSHTGAFPPRGKRYSASTSLMTQSNYETYSSETGGARYMPSPRRPRRPWR